jgi:hypothetical protein
MVPDGAASIEQVQALYRYVLFFAWGFFFVLGVMAMSHAAGHPPHTIGQAFAISVLGGLGGLVIRRRLDQQQARDRSAPRPGGAQNRSR